MTTNQLKYVHGVLVMAQAKAEGAEVELLKSAIRMIEKGIMKGDKQ
jgi:hypothetical protein